MFVPKQLWIVIASLVLTVLNPILPLAFMPETEELSLEVSLVSSQSEIITGDVAQWNLSIQGSDSITLIEIKLIDETTWAWAEQPPSQISLTQADGIVLELSVIPLISGVLHPGVLIIYQNENQVSEQLVQSSPVQSVPVTSHVLTEIVFDQKTIQSSDEFTTSLWIVNQSPFTLTQVSIEGFGIDISWLGSAPVNDITPGQSSSMSMKGMITGSHPQPQLFLNYHWTDAVSNENEYSGYLLGDPLELFKPEQTWWERIPNELITALVGLVIGILSSLVISWSKDRLDRKLRKKSNQSKVLGMLQMLILQAEQASEKGTSIDAGIVETIIQNDELNEALSELKLSHDVRELWKAAQHHNQNLGRPAGAQRSERLYEAAKALSRLLNKSKKGIEEGGEDVENKHTG